MSYINNEFIGSWSHEKNGAICPHCLDRMKCKDFISKETLAWICKNTRARSSFAYLPKTEFPIAMVVHYLEKDGYIVTTEYNESIELAIVNPATTFFIREQGYYCWCHWQIDKERKKENDIDGINGVDFNEGG